jgi:hypothetical protein
MEEVIRKFFLLLFFGSASVLATFFLKGVILPILAPVVFIALTVCIANITARYGKVAGVEAALVYLFFSFLTIYINYFPTILISLAMFSFPFFYGFEFERKNFAKIIKESGVSRREFWRSAVKGIATAVLVLLLVFVEALLILHFRLDEPGKVVSVAKELPLYILIFSFLFSPVAEEIFFRGFLLPRVGVVTSSLLFALAHFFYGSLIEFVATFTAGLIFAVMRRRGSLVPCIFAHATFNLINVIIILFYVRA